MLIPPSPGTIPTVMVGELAAGLPALIVSAWVTVSWTLTAALVASLVLQGGTLPNDSPRSKANPPTLIAEALPMLGVTTSRGLNATVALMPNKSAVGKPADGSTAMQPASHNRNL